MWDILEFFLPHCPNKRAKGWSYISLTPLPGFSFPFKAALCGCSGIPSGQEEKRAGSLSEICAFLGFQQGV